jgi:alpha-tubulin suppressor-like RCC1 family protein
LIKVLTNKNEVYVWGENEDGQLGLPQLNDQEVKSSVVPKKLEFTDPVVDIDCG